MNVYVPRLTWAVVVKALQRRLSGAWPRGSQIMLMDGPANGRWARPWVGLLAAAGYRVAEVPFFAGHLRTTSGEAVRPAARRAATALADRSAAVLLRASPALSAIDARWDRNTVRLMIAKRMFAAAEYLTLRVFVAEALARVSQMASTLIVPWPHELPPAVGRELSTEIAVVTAGHRRASWRSGRLGGTLWALRQAVRKYRRPRLAAIPDDGSPALLMMQEDDVSLDRSVRSQPHWLTTGDAPTFRTIVLRSNELTSVDLSVEDRAAMRLEIIDAGGVSASGSKPAVSRALRADGLRACLLGALSRRSADSFAFAETTRLLFTASNLAELCVARHVTAFLTCENYFLEADAMQLLAGPMGIRTLSYQYSALPYPSLPLITTADQLVTFAPMYHERFVFPGFQPPAFVDAGYVFSSNFRHVRQRAANRRDRMVAAGASWIVGVFDESVQRDKYGLVHAVEYERELMDLVDWLRRDPSLGIVFKTQFQGQRGGLSPQTVEAVAAAEATGRFEMPARGRHRNAVLPAEVAASADITIGHAIGGTASLESALIGCRSLIINSYGFVSGSDKTYARADVVYPSLSDACLAINQLRAGDPAKRALGDWTPILREFDPFGDEDSATRFRAIVTAAVVR